MAHLRTAILFGSAGRRPWKYEAQVEAAQWWGPETMRSWQEARLNELVGWASKQSPYYRKRLAPFLARAPRYLSLEHLRELPLLSKDEIRSHETEILTSTSTARLTMGRTSGTTGAPVRTWHEKSYSSWIMALQRRAFRWYGVEPWSPTFYIGGVAENRLGRIKEHVVDAWIDRLTVPCYDMRDETLDRIIEQVRRFRPRIVTGFVSALRGLAMRSLDRGTAPYDAGVSLIVPISEMMADDTRELLRRAFGAPVLSEYGCVEIGAMAYGCPAGRLHISHEHVLFEVIRENGDPCEPGESGRVVLTPLTPRAMPLIRYELGDLGSLTDERCSCGRYPGLKLLHRIEGRTFDRILDADGKWWHAFTIYFGLKEVFDPLAFKEFQGIQDTPGAVELRIVPGPTFSEEKANGLRAAVEARVRGPIKVTWRLVDGIPREGSGKLKYFKSTLSPTMEGT